MVYKYKIILNLMQHISKKFGQGHVYSCVTLVLELAWLYDFSSGSPLLCFDLHNACTFFKGRPVPARITTLIITKPQVCDHSRCVLFNLELVKVWIVHFFFVPKDMMLICQEAWPEWLKTEADSRRFVQKNSNEGVYLQNCNRVMSKTQLIETQITTKYLMHRATPDIYYVLTDKTTNA